MERTLQNQLAWLAGIIDGEGHIGAWLKPFRSKNRARNGQRMAKQYTALAVSVCVGNTDILMIEEIEAIARQLGLKTTRILNDPQLRVRKRLFWTVTFYSMKQVEPLLRAVLPYLVNKRERAEQILRIIEYRRRTFCPSKTLSVARIETDEWLRRQIADLRIRETKE